MTELTAGAEFCRNCGARLAGARFCASCGTPADATVAGSPCQALRGQSGSVSTCGPASWS